METLFLKILNMSLTASYAIAAVLLVRLLLGQAPKKWSYLLWAVVGFRLICPVSWRSAFSLFSLTPAAPAVSAGVGSVMEYIPPDIGLAARPSVNVGIPAVSAALPTATPLNSVNPMQIWLFIGAVLWCVGMAALLLCGIVSYVRLAHRLREAVLLRDNIYETDMIRSPFILGVFRPKIFLPLGLEGDTLRYVLAHENYHLRRRDYLVKLFAFGLLVLHWFNPLVWLAFCLMSRDMEMSCDERVLSGEDGIAKAYSLSLLSFAENRCFPVPAPLAFGESGVKSRIRNVLNWKQSKVWVTVVSAVLALAVLIGCGGNPAGRTDQQTADHSDLTVTLDSPQTSRLTLETLLKTAAERGDALSWADFEAYTSTASRIGPFHCRDYAVDDNFTLRLKGVRRAGSYLEGAPVYCLSE